MDYLDIFTCVFNRHNRTLLKSKYKHIIMAIVYRTQVVWNSLPRDNRIAVRPTPFRGLCIAGTPEALWRAVKQPNELRVVVFLPHLFPLGTYIILFLSPYFSPFSIVSETRPSGIHKGDNLIRDVWQILPQGPQANRAHLLF